MFSVTSECDFSNLRRNISYCPKFKSGNLKKKRSFNVVESSSLVRADRYITIKRNVCVYMSILFPVLIL